MYLIVNFFFTDVFDSRANISFLLFQGMIVWIYIYIIYSLWTSKAEKDIGPPMSTAAL